MEENTFSRNSLMFIAMANEFCHDMERSAEFEREAFIDKMLKMLPRLYMSISDVEDLKEEDEPFYIEYYLQEEVYNDVRNGVYQLMGEDDTYLEVFEEGMKYSDTPIATTISENLSDLYQEFYNLVVTIQNTPTEVAGEILSTIKENFKTYWGQTLVNVMRALHNVKYNESDFEL